MNAWTKRCVTVFLLSFLATAYAATFNVNVKANFITPCTGASNYNPGQYGCTLSPSTQNFNANPVAITWGKGALSESLQSGLSFLAYSSLTLGDTPATAQAIGQLTHTNYPLDCGTDCAIYTPTDFAFALQVLVNVPGQTNPVPFVGEYSIKMNETPNTDQRTGSNTCPIADGEASWVDAGGWNTALPCCPYYSTPLQPATPFSQGGPCSDRLVVTKTYTSNSFPYNGVSYTLMLLGFSSSATSYNPVNPSFTSQENQNSVAYIWAYIRQTCTSGGCNDGKACTQDSCGADGLCVNTPINVGGACTDAWNYDASATCTAYKCASSGTCLGSNKPNGQTCTTTAPLPGGKTSDCMVSKCNTGVCQWQQKNDNTPCTTSNAGQLYALGSWNDCNSIGCRSGACTFSTAIGQTCSSISVKTCNAAKCKATTQFGATVARCTGSAVYPLQSGSCFEGAQKECKRRTCVANGLTLGTCGTVANDNQGSCTGAGIRSCQRRSCSGGVCAYFNNQNQGSCSQSKDGTPVTPVFCNKRTCNSQGTCKLSYDSGQSSGSCAGQFGWQICTKRVCHSTTKYPPGSCGYVITNGGSCASGLPYRFCNTRKCNSVGSCRYVANTAEPGSCTALFPPRDCWKRTCRSTTKYPPGSCGPQPNDDQGSCLVITLANQGGCTLGYPYTSSNPRTSQTFAEDTCLRAFDGGTSLTDTIRVYYADEHPLTLGVRRTGWNFTEWDSPNTLPYKPGAVYYPAVGDLTATDPAGRPIYPALFITDITEDANSHAGDWQWYGTPVTPHAVFGSWKAGNYTGDGKLPALDSDKIYAKPSSVSWSNLGPSADTPPNNPILNGANEYWVTEIRWNVWELTVGGQPLQVGRSYRVQFMVHDGDLNSGDGAGDAGEACINIKVMGAYPCNKRVCKSGSCGYKYLAGSCASLKNWSECKKRVCKDTGSANFLPGSCAYSPDTQQNSGSCFSLPVQECRKRNCNTAGTCASVANQAQGSCTKTYSYVGLSASCSKRVCNSAGSCAFQSTTGSCNTGKTSNDYTCFKQRCRSEATGGGTCSTSVRNGVSCSALGGRPCADPKCNANGQCALSPKNLGASCVDASKGTSTFCNPLQCDSVGSCSFNPTSTEDTPNCLTPPDSNAAVCITSACKSGTCRDTSDVAANNNTKVCKGLSPTEDSCHSYFCYYGSTDIHNHQGTCVSQPNPARLNGECSIPNNPDSDLDQKCYELKCAADGTCTRNFYNSGTFCGYPPNTVITNGYACSQYVCDGVGHCDTGTPVQVPDGEQCAGQVPCPWYEPGCNGECQQFVCQSGQCMVDNYREGQNCSYIKPKTARDTTVVNNECGQGKCLQGFCTVVNTANGTSCGNRTKYNDLCYGDYCDGNGACVHTQRKSCVGALPLPNVCFDATCEAATGECVLVSNGVVDCSCITDCSACTAAFSYNPNSTGRRLGCYWCTGSGSTGPACYNRHLPTGENFPRPSGVGSCYTDDSPCGGGGGLTGGAIAGIVVGVLGLSSLLALIFALGALLVRYFSTAGTPPASASLTDLAFERDVKNCAIYQGADLGGVSALYAEPKFITA